VTSTESSALGRAKQLVRRVRPRSRDEQPRLDEVAARLNRQHGRIAAVERELARIGPQVAAIEVRLEDLRQRLDQPGSNDAERAEAASLVEEIRREHQRIRARISAATRYEERLRQLEETVSRLGADRPEPTG
jgi:predicted  nucleic acid-binding Zn-ribbon protein